MDIKMGTNSDMVIENGDLAFVKNTDAIAQHIRIRLQTWLGESPYDQNAGVPYQQVFFLPTTNELARRFILEQRTIGTPGVLGAVIDQIDSDYQNRTMVASGTATSIDGDVTFTISLGEITS